MALLRLACLIAAVLAGSRAQAACPITMEGDAEVAARIAEEVAGFPGDDGAPCVAVHAACDAGDGGITLELRDELGGQAVRTFETAAGAAAFLVSWSRRPAAGVEVHEAIAVPRVAAVAPALRARAEAPPEPTPVPGPQSATTAEVAAAGMISGTAMASVGVAVFRGRTGSQLGVAARAVSGLTSWDSNVDRIEGVAPHLAYVAGLVELAYRIAGPSATIRTRLEIAGGVTAITRVAHDGEVDLLSRGLHEGVRLAAWLPIGGGLALEAGLGVEIMWQTGSQRYRSPIGDRDVAAYPHLEVGLRWCL